MKTTYTVPEVPGSKRTSARPYTFAVIGYSDVTRSVARLRARNEAERTKTLRYLKQNWESWNRQANAAPGTTYVNHNGYLVTAKEPYIDIAKGFIERNPSLEAYIANTDAESEANLASIAAKGDGPLEVLRWSSSKANAEKGLYEFQDWYSDLRVVPCIPVVKG